MVKSNYEVDKMTNVTNEMIMQVLQGLQSEMKEIKQDMHQRFDKVDNELREIRVELNDFKQLSTEEHDRVVEKLDTITRQTANNTEKISYLAGEVGKHSMILNVIDKQ